MTRYSVFLLVFWAFLGPVIAQEADRKLDAFFKSYLDQWFELQPLDATRLGDHRFDDQLEDLSASSRKKWNEHSVGTLKRLAREIEYAKLSRGRQIDYEI